MPAPAAAGPIAKAAGKMLGRAAASRAIRGRQGGGDQDGGPTSGLLLAVLLVLGAPLGVVVGLVVLIGALGGGQQAQACETGAGEPPAGGTGPGALGEVGGSGIKSELVERVRDGSPFAGEKITPGRYGTTAYGPPWGGIQGEGIQTSGGLPINGGRPKWYMVAVDPALIDHGTWVYIWPNPFNWKGAFLAADTGGAIKGRRIDFYDWRGRAKQIGWALKQSRVSSKPIVGDSADQPSDADQAAAVPVSTQAASGGACAGGSGAAADFKRVQTVGQPRRFKQLPANLMAAGRPAQAVDARIYDNVVYVLRRYKMRVTAAREPGHATHGDGTAIDAVPAQGNAQGAWDNSTLRAAEALGWTERCGGSGMQPACKLAPAIKFIGYEGYPSHGSPKTCSGGCPAHIHISWDSSSYGSGPLSPPPEWVKVFPPKGDDNDERRNVSDDKDRDRDDGNDGDGGGPGNRDDRDDDTGNDDGGNGGGGDRDDRGRGPNDGDDGSDDRQDDA